MGGGKDLVKIDEKAEEKFRLCLGYVLKINKTLIGSQTPEF